MKIRILLTVVAAVVAISAPSFAAVPTAPVPQVAQAQAQVPASQVAAPAADLAAGQALAALPTAAVQSVLGSTAQDCVSGFPVSSCANGQTECPSGCLCMHFTLCCYCP